MSMAGEGAFKKILVPVDDSVASLAAQELAASIAKTFKSSVMVLNVVSHKLMSPSFQGMVGEIGAQEFAPSQIARGEYSMARKIAPQGSGGGLPPKMMAEINDYYHQRGSQVADEAVKLFKEEGILPKRKVIEHSDKADSILREAQSGKYSLVVIGRSGEKDNEATLTGTTEKVVRHAKIPVLVAGERKKIAKVLVPVDGSKGSDKALNQAVILAKKFGAKITFLHVQEKGLFGSKPEMAKQVGKHVLAIAAKKAKGVETDERLESGDVGKKIGEVAEKEDYDIIVMGSKGHGGIKRFLLGSASNHVLHYTSHPVLIVK
jgi:nucleotide-binding universal stress UspA family protein